jgi:hypothetical protein
MTRGFAPLIMKGFHRGPDFGGFSNMASTKMDIVNGYKTVKQLMAF